MEIDKDDAPIELTVRDGTIALMLIRRFIKTGLMEDAELMPLAVLRTKLVERLQQATGINYDQNIQQTSTNN